MRPAFLDEMSWSMAEVYGAVTDRILINLARYFPYVKPGEELPGAFEYQARMLAKMGQVNRDTADIIMQSLDGADAALRGALETAILDALKNEEPKLRKAAEQGLLGSFIPPEVAPGQMQAFKSYYAQSADKLNLVNTVMLESTQAAYTATVSDVVNRIQNTQAILNTGAGEVITGVSSWNTAMHDAVQKMVDNGLTGFIDHGGHRWSPEAYVAMDIRTTMFNTSRAAINERAQEYGCDLYQVSSHNGARPLCYPWQGKVISRSGWTGTVEDLDGNKVTVHSESEIESFRYGGGLFGVNCGHYPMNFIPGVSTIKGEPQDPEENEKTYAESQEQRALERKLRAERRDLEVMKAQGADEQAIKAQRAKVRKASADIDQFCEDTGRARRRNREYTPVDAKFPPKDSYDVSQFENEQKKKIDQFYQNGSAQKQYQSGVMDGNATNTQTPIVNNDRVYSSKEEYVEARKNRLATMEKERAEAEQWYNAEKDKLAEEYGGSFMRQRVAVRTDTTLTDEEKEIRLAELKAKEAEMKARRCVLYDEYERRYSAAYERYSAVFEPEYEYSKIPGAQTMRENAKAVNPNWSFSKPEYTVNCQRCGVAYELRSRGYNVQAMPAPDGGIGAPATIKQIFSESAELSFDGTGHDNTIRVLEQMREWGEGSRGVAVVNRIDGGGHVFNVAQKDGKFWIIDSQVNAVWNNAETGLNINGGAFEESSVTHVTVYRVDNVKLHDVPEGWVRDIGRN